MCDDLICTTTFLCATPSGAPGRKWKEGSCLMMKLLSLQVEQMGRAGWLGVVAFALSS